MQTLNPDTDLPWLAPGLGSLDTPIVLGVDQSATPAVLYRLKRQQIHKARPAVRTFVLSQDSQDWHKWRAGGIGASESSAALGLNPYQTKLQLWEVKVGKAEPSQENEHMRRGKRKEPLARAAYEQLMGYSVEPLCCCHDEYPWLKASLDGITSDRKLILELKAPGKRRHAETLYKGEVPEYYWVQVQHQLLVTGARVAHFCTYNDDDYAGGLQLSPPVVIRPDREFQVDMLAELEVFWKCVVEGREPI